MDNPQSPSDRWFGSELAIWFERMGYNGKQVGKAAELLGMSARSFVRKRDGERGAELTQTDRLAMAALRAGLPPWTPENDGYIAGVRRLRDTVSEVTGWPDVA